MSEERIYWLAWSKVLGVGPILRDRLKQHFNSLGTAWNADREQLLAIDGLGLVSVEKLIAYRAKIDPEKLIIEHTQTNPLFWAQSDPDYPRLLAEIPSAPAVLYYKGQVSHAENQGLLPTFSHNQKGSEYQQYQSWELIPDFRRGILVLYSIKPLVRKESQQAI